MEDIPALLKTLPGTRLRLLSLAWELVNDDGTLDDAKVLFYEKELAEALKEAEAYARASANAVQCLKVLLQ
ncbi:hypothetical protein ES703_38445 [subsurface metagenome]